MGMRELDALFAERVLGDRKVWHQQVIIPQPNDWYGGPNDGWYMRHTRGYILAAGGDCTIPEYTKSLDAAWQGVKKAQDQLPKEYGYDFTLYRYANDKNEWVWSCFFEPCDPAALWHKAEESHPALAIVKACLLAVGVTQEEIDAAEAA